MRTSVLLAAATGALTTYFMDPYRGRRRRAIARDKLSLSGTLAAVRQRGAREDVPDERHEQRIDFMQANWSPATRRLAGGGGAIMALYGLARRSPGALLLGAAGIALLVRAGTRRGAKQINFTKTIHIAAPVDKVFAFWSNFENFPKFMRNVRKVSKTAENRWHWEVAGPLGATVQWDATTTQHVPNERIAWSTTSGAQVQHAGIVRFQPEGEGTRVQIEMSYNPPAGALGHAVASLFGADPQAQMDADLMRLKGYFETGKAARDAAAARAPA